MTSTSLPLLPPDRDDAIVGVSYHYGGRTAGKDVSTVT